jgi:hypothetical protein
MGLDIIQGFDLEEHDEDFDIEDFEDHYKLSVSRTFCNFMCRKGVVQGEPDLDQIGRMFNIDISPLYLMESYTAAWEFEEMMEFEDDPIEVERRLKEQNQKVIGNIDSVVSLLSELILQLEKARNLSDKIDDNGFQSVLETYYENLNTREEVDYLDNNLVQDLRNLLRATKLAKSKGAETTFFTYG